MKVKSLVFIILFSLNCSSLTKEALEHGLRSKSIDHTLPTAKIENRIKENFFKIAELILTDTHITSLEIKNISLIQE